jgi:NOL1/NOP2/fmu family ribosome biogenesis protein
LDLDEVLVRYQLRLFTRFNQLFLIPGTYLEQFSFLPYAYIGMPIGKWDGQAFEPSFEFVSRFGYHFTSGKILISESFVEQWVSGRDIRYPETSLSPEGQYLMVTDPLGRNLGLGRLLPKRLRNLLPRQSV